METKGLEVGTGLCSETSSTPSTLIQIYTLISSFPEVGGGGESKAPVLIHGERFPFDSSGNYTHPPAWKWGLLRLLWPIIKMGLLVTWSWVWLSNSLNGLFGSGGG